MCPIGPIPATTQIVPYPIAGFHPPTTPDEGELIPTDLLNPGAEASENSRSIPPG
jgi:hypothetical protein